MKNIKFLQLTAAALAATASVSLFANPATAPYDPSNFQAQLQVSIAKETDIVHFIRDNADPDVFTKTYVLKHADPYEIRAYIRGAVQSKRVDSKRTVVECIKYNDGTGMLIVSAEDYRFVDHPNGIGIDTMIAKLDQPKIKASSGQLNFLYFPTNVSARDLQTMIRNVGANVATTLETDYEVEYGKDTVSYDNELNALFLYSTVSSRKTIEYMLKQYDIPNPEVLMKFAVYEVYAENDGKIGADFQAWKNNEGMDFLSVGARYRDNWTATNAGIGGVNGNLGSNRTQYFNFNPKWNSRYLDLLTAKGHAKIMTSGEIAIKNGKTANLSRLTRMFYDEVVERAPDVLELHYNVADGVVPGTVVGYDNAGTPITVSGAVTSVNAVRAKVSITRADQNGEVPITETRYYLTLQNKGSSFFYKDGALLGDEAQAASVSNIFPVTGWIKTNDLTMYKGPVINTKPSQPFGFNMTVTPAISGEATLVDIVMSNTSLIGWQSSGSPRLSRDSNVTTRVMLGNGTNRFVIGGLEKREIVRSVSGVPILKDLPFIGFFFSSESESTKRSQLILVAECTPITPDTAIKSGIQGDISKLGNDLKDTGKTNYYGFDQWLLDSEKKADWDTY